MAKKIKNTGKGKYLVRVMANLCECSNRKAKAVVKKVGADVVVIAQRMPRSSKRVERMIPRKDFIQLSFNKETGDVEFMLRPRPTEVFSAIGEVEIKGNTVIITDEDTGMTSILPLEDCIIEAADDSEGGSKRGKRSKPEKNGKKGRKSKPADEDEDEEEDEDSEEEDEDEDESESDDEEDEDSDEDEDDDESESDDDDEDEDDDSDSDDEDEDDEDDDDSDSDSEEEEEDEDDEEDDEDDEDEAPRKGKGKKGGRR